MSILETAGAVAAGVVIALDRQARYCLVSFRFGGRSRFVSVMIALWLTCCLSCLLSVVVANDAHDMNMKKERQ